MVEHLATLIESFPGALNQTRCFTHILNLVAKSVLRQFEAPKKKRGNASDDMAKELAVMADELDDDEPMLEDDVANDQAPNSHDSEDGEDGEDESEGGDDETVNDDEDRLPDERDGMSEEDLAELEDTVKPVRVRDCQGFQNPWGSGVWVQEGRVWVRILYPHETLTLARGQGVYQGYVQGNSSILQYF
jgi:hypothetical protein